MRKILIGLMTVILLSANGTDYCDGFNEGYEAGYCYEDPGCVAPAPPACPVPEPGYDTWRDGYNTGFAKGRADRD